MPTTIYIQGFTLAELSPKARERALGELQEMQSEFWNPEYWNLPEWRKDLAAKGYPDADICYSGFGSQGDGASFTCKHVDLEKWVNADRKTRRRFRKLLKHADLVYAHVDRTGHHYYHSNSVTAYAEPENDLPEALVPLVKDLEAALAADVKDLSRRIYRDLEDSYMAEISEEACKDTAEANDILFRASGHIAPRSDPEAMPKQEGG